MTGSIRTLRVDKGFGFIKDDAGKEYFFHQSAVYGEGIDNLREGDRVGSEVGEGPKGPPPFGGKATVVSASSQCAMGQRSQSACAKGLGSAASGGASPAPVAGPRAEALRVSSQRDAGPIGGTGVLAVWGRRCERGLGAIGRD